MEFASADSVLAALAIGMGATAVMDLWAEFQKRAFGIKPLDYALVGRWLGNCGGRHESVSSLRVVPGEKILGWTAHYAIGATFGLMLLFVWGSAWLRDPKLLPALIVGLGSVVAPFFVLQPCLGLGVAASNTPRPWISRARSLSAHAGFAVGLYLAGMTVSKILY